MIRATLRCGALALLVGACASIPGGTPAPRGADTVRPPESAARHCPDTTALPGTSDSTSRFAFRVVCGIRYGVSIHSPAQIPMEVQISVEVSDTAAKRPTGIPFASCPLALRVYRSPDRSGAPAWHSERLSECPSAVVSTPRSEFAAFRHPAWRILGDTLPEGPYYFTVVLRLGQDTLEFRPTGEFSSIPLVADTLPPTWSRETLQYRVDTRVERIAPRELRSAVTLINTGSRYVAVDYGGCRLKLRAYRTPARTGRPVWISELRRPPHPNSIYACDYAGAQDLIAPGQAISPEALQIRVPFYEIVADSLPTGMYYFTAVLDFRIPSTDPRTRRPQQDTVRLPAGEAWLTAEPDPVPSERRTGIPAAPGRNRSFSDISQPSAPDAHAQQSGERTRDHRWCRSPVHGLLRQPEPRRCTCARGALPGLGTMRRVPAGRQLSHMTETP